MISRGTYDFVRTLFGPLTAEIFAGFTGGVLDPHVPPASRPRASRRPRAPRDPARGHGGRDAARALRRQHMQLARALNIIARLSGETLPTFDRVLLDSRAEQLEQIRRAVRIARFRTHPDRNPGRTTRDFLRVQSAAERLGHCYGVIL